MTHKAGFVNIIGNPNVGKSTLMNEMIGERLSIITSKAQTTRHRIFGIVNEDDYQIVFSDTPGLLKPKYKLQESMLSAANSAFEDADVLLYVTDVNETYDKHVTYIQKLQKATVPVLVLINKIDLSDQTKLEELVVTWKKEVPQAEIYPLSAKEKFNIDQIFKRILELIPDSPPYFDKDALTDKSERFFVSEIIREKVLLNYQKEIPYAVEVEVEAFKEEGNITNIKSVIHVERNTQKGIIIGHQGKMLKKTGTEARIDIEKFLGRKVFLELFVKVSKDWRSKDKNLKSFGY